MSGHLGQIYLCRICDLEPYAESHTVSVLSEPALLPCAVHSLSPEQGAHSIHPAALPSSSEYRSRSGLKPAAVACYGFLRNCAVRWGCGSFLSADEITYVVGGKKLRACSCDS